MEKIDVFRLCDLHPSRRKARFPLVNEGQMWTATPLEKQVPQGRNVHNGPTPGSPCYKKGRVAATRDEWSNIRLLL